MEKPVSTDSETIRLWLKLVYIGTDFFGWQKQTHGKSIQDALEKALQTALRQPVKTLAASRTDTGVHALDQMVVTAPLAKKPDLKRLQKSLNGLLPDTVSVVGVGVCAPDFHPIRDCVGKVYRYCIWNEFWQNPFLKDLTWHVRESLDAAAMQKASKVFLGRHDFTSFCASDSSAKTKVREIFELEVHAKASVIEIWVRGDGFLKQMVRNMAGALVAAGLGKIQAADLTAILRAKDRRQAPKTAPAQGLTLMRLFYQEAGSLKVLLGETKESYTMGVIKP